MSEENDELNTSCKDKVEKSKDGSRGGKKNDTEDRE